MQTKRSNVLPHWQQGFFLFRAHSGVRRRVTFMSFGEGIKLSHWSRRTWFN